ncbi:hypothetical protein MWMV18_MWMV18_03225 [Acinetobacter calcoaceticus]|nr:hypothetical protein MWMV18_MWMV18_03225 [Acinetobacter calcoaceticus]
MSSEINIDNHVNLSIQYINKILEYCSDIQNTYRRQLTVIEIDMSSKFLKDFDYNFYGIPNIESYTQQITDYINNYKWVAERLRKLFNEENNNLYNFINLENINIMLNKHITIIQNLNSLFSLCYNKVTTIHAGYHTYDMNSVLNGEDENSRKIFINELNEIEKIKLQIVNIFPSIISELLQATDDATLTKNKINTLVRDITTKQTIDFDKSLEEIQQIIKNYENNISLLTEKFENRYKGFVQDTEKVKQSSDLLNTNIDKGIKNTIELNNKIQQMEIDFSSIIKDKLSLIDQDLDNKNLIINQKLDEKISLIDNQFNALRSRVNTKTEKIKTAQKDLMVLLEKTSIHKLTENYKDKADNEKKDYKINSRITIGAIICAILTTTAIIGLPIYEYWEHVPPVEPNYYTIVARLTVSLMFFVLAIYTSKQAAKHYECYQENNRTYLQLAALEPFMSRMSDDEQKAIRKGLIPIYFNQNADGKFASKGDELGMQVDIQAFGEKLMDIGKSLAERNSK